LEISLYDIGFYVYQQSVKDEERCHRTALFLLAAIEIFGLVKFFFVKYYHFARIEYFIQMIGMTCKEAGKGNGCGLMKPSVKSSKAS